MSEGTKFVNYVSVEFPILPAKLPWERIDFPTARMAKGYKPRAKPWVMVRIMSRPGRGGGWPETMLRPSRAGSVGAGPDPARRPRPRCRQHLGGLERGLVKAVVTYSASADTQLAEYELRACLGGTKYDTDTEVVVDSHAAGDVMPFQTDIGLYLRGRR